MGYLVLAVIAAAGFLASLACHLMGWLQIDPPWGKAVYVLHVSALVLWVPLTVFVNRTQPPPKRRRGNLDHVFAEVPKWLRVAGTILFVYAFLNFAHFVYCTRQYPRHGVPSHLELRGFSGHWMLFHGIAAIGFLSLARLTWKRKEHDSIA